MVLDVSLHNTQHYMVRIKGKVEQSSEWSSALPYTLMYWKASLPVTFDNGCQLYSLLNDSTGEIIFKLTLKIISLVESFLCPDKQGTPEESRRIQRPKRCVSTNSNKDEVNSPKNYTQNDANHIYLMYMYEEGLASMKITANSQLIIHVSFCSKIRVIRVNSVTIYVGLLQSWETIWECLWL